MVDNQNEKTMIPASKVASLRNKSSQELAIRRAEAGAADYVVHLNLDQVRDLAEATLRQAIEG